MIKGDTWRGVHLWTKRRAMYVSCNPYRVHSTMADHDRARQRIVASVFDKRNAAADVQESYVAHIKIWEDAGDGQGKKPRYIIISRPCTPPHPVPADLHPRHCRQLRLHTQVEAQHQRLLLRRQDLEARRAQRPPGPQRAFPAPTSPSIHAPTPSRSPSTSPLRGPTSGRRKTPSTRPHLSEPSSTSSVPSSMLPSISSAWMAHPAAHSQQQMGTPPTTRPCPPPPRSPSQTACSHPRTARSLPRPPIPTFSRPPHVLHPLRVP